MTSRPGARQQAKTTSKRPTPNQRIRPPSLRCNSNAIGYSSRAAAPNNQNPADGSLAHFLCELQAIALAGHVTQQQLKNLRQFIDESAANESRKSDSRFIKACLDYGKLSGSTNVMFNFMVAKGIGKTQASFYYHWAKFLEKTGHVSEAKNAVYQGIAADAQPSALLVQFQTDLDRLHPPKAVVDAKPIVTAKAFGDTQPNTTVLPLKHEPSYDQIDVVALDVYRDDTTDDEDAVDIFEQLHWSYPEQLLKHRSFNREVRPFSTEPIPLIVNCVQRESVTAGKLAKIIYGPHRGVTEPIAAAQFAKAGDTEALN